MSPETALPETAESEPSLSALGIVWVAAGLFVVIALFAFADRFRLGSAHRDRAAEPTIARERECTQTTPRLPAEFVA